MRYYERDFDGGPNVLLITQMRVGNQHPGEEAVVSRIRLEGVIQDARDMGATNRPQFDGSMYTGLGKMRQVNIPARQSTVLLCHFTLPVNDDDGKGDFPATVQGDVVFIDQWGERYWRNCYWDTTNLQE
jgi:hypothetical protein